MRSITKIPLVAALLIVVVALTATSCSFFNAVAPIEDAELADVLFNSVFPAGGGDMSLVIGGEQTSRSISETTTIAFPFGMYSASLRLDFYHLSFDPAAETDIIAEADRYRLTATASGVIDRPRFSGSTTLYSNLFAVEVDGDLTNDSGTLSLSGTVNREAEGAWQSFRTDRSYETMYDIESVYTAVSLAVSDVRDGNYTLTPLGGTVGLSGEIIRKKLNGGLFATAEQRREIEVDHFIRWHNRSRANDQ
jgi:hypothetical protein